MPEIIGAPARGLPSIFAKYPNDVPTVEVIFLDEDTMVGCTRLLPRGVTLSQLKEQVTKDHDFPADGLCEQPLKLFYAEGGLSQMEHEEELLRHEAGSAPKRGKKKHHEHVTELKDEKKWEGANRHWAKGGKTRRDVLLVKFTAEVCGVISEGHPGPQTFAAANRLCNIVAVPHNVTSLARLHKSYLIHHAVTDLLDYRDPWDEGIDPEHTGKRRVGGSAECLSVACGAHLHWHMAGQSEHFFNKRCGGVDLLSDGEDDGVPEPYQKYRRLLVMGLGEEAAVEMILAEGLDPSVLGLGDGAGGAKDNDFTTLPLLRALRRAVGAVRHRQLSKLAMSAAARQAVASSLVGVSTSVAVTDAKKHGEEGVNEAKEREEGGAVEPTVEDDATVASSSSSSSSSASSSGKYIKPEPVAAVAIAKRFVIPKRHPVCTLDSIDELAHGEWALADDRALDLAAFHCLGACWCNLVAAPAARARHGEEVLTYAVALAVHGGASTPGDGDNEPGSPKSPTKTPASPGSGRTPKTPGSAGGGAGVSAAPPKPVLVRGLAAHLACFLLANEPTLRSALAKHSHSAASSQAYEELSGLQGQVCDARFTASVPGLARLMWSPDAEVAFAGAAIVASLVASPLDQAMLAAAAADLSLAPTLAFAVVAVGFDRLGPRGNLGKGTDLQRTLRGADGGSAVSALDHALVAVWGLLHVLLSCKSPALAAAADAPAAKHGLKRGAGPVVAHAPAQSVHAPGRLSGHLRGQAQTAADGPCLAAESVLAGRLASKPQASLAAPEGLHADIGFARISATAARQFRPKKNALAIVAEEGANGDKANIDATFHIEGRAFVSEEDTAASAAAEDEAAAAVLAVKANLLPKGKSSLMKKFGKPLAAATLAPLQLAVLKTSKQGGGAAAREAALGANLKALGAVEAVLLLCTWNYDGATDESDDTAPLAAGPESPKVTATGPSLASAAAEELGKVSRPPTQDEGNDDGEPTVQANASLEDVRRSGDIRKSGDIESNVPMSQSVGSPTSSPAGAVNANLLPLGSGGGRFGALSEVEVRCSIAALAVCAAADCIGVTRGLGPRGLSRLLVLAEQGPEVGRSEEVQESAMSCINALSLAASDVYERPPYDNDPRVREAREVLGAFVSDEAAIERLASIRTAVVGRARAHASDAASAAEPRLRRALKEAQQRRWGAAKSASVATTNFASLAGKGGGQWGGKGKGGGTDTQLSVGGGGGGLAAMFGKKKGFGFGTVVVQARAKVMFARKRIVCVASQLWSENRSVVTEACASLWLLGRDESARKELAKLCLDSNMKAGVPGLAGPIIPRLVDCAKGVGGGDPRLRSWALASINALLVEATVRGGCASLIRPVLVEVLHEYAKVGDRAERRQRRFDKAAQSSSASLGSGNGGSSVFSGTSSTGAGGGLAMERVDDLAKQRLAALAVSGLLALCYFHDPSLMALRLGVGVGNDAAATHDSDAHSVEAPLLKLMMRAASCRRLKRRCGQLLLLVCAEDMDRVLSGEKDKSPSYAAAQALAAARAPSQESTCSSQEVKNPAAPVAFSAASVPSTPLGRLSRAATGAPEGLVLESTFLHLLHEQMGPEDDYWEADKDGDEGCKEGTLSWWGATKDEPHSPGFGASVEDSGASGARGGGDSLLSAQANAFGFGAGGDGDDSGRERDCLRHLCLHALVNLAARRDKAKVFFARHGAARLAARLMREPRPKDLNDDDDGGDGDDDDGVDDDDNGKNIGETGGDEAAVEARAEAKAKAAKSQAEDAELPSGWKRTLPLHFLVNCSSAEDAQLSVCGVALDDLLRATMTPPSSHALAALETQLAFACLANLSRSTPCRANIYRRSLDAGILPPGARDNAAARDSTILTSYEAQAAFEEGAAARKAAGRKGAHRGHTATTQAQQRPQTAGPADREESWQVAPGKEPLYEMIKARAVASGSGMVAPTARPKLTGRSKVKQIRKAAETRALFETTALAATLRRPSTAPNEPSSEPSTEGSGVLTSPVKVRHGKGAPGGGALGWSSLVWSHKSHSFENTTAHPFGASGLIRMNHLSHDVLPHPAAGLFKTAAGGEVLSSFGFRTGKFGGFDDHHKEPTFDRRGRMVEANDDESAAASDVVGAAVGLGVTLPRDGVHGTLTSDAVGEHVANVHGWLMNSHLSAAPPGAPQLLRIRTNPPITLPAPEDAAKATQLVMEQRTAKRESLALARMERSRAPESAPPIAAPVAAPADGARLTGDQARLTGDQARLTGDQPAGAQSATRTEPPKRYEKPPPGASTNRNAARGGVQLSSLIPVNGAYPHGVDTWHPDIVHAVAAVKETKQDPLEPLGKAEELAGSALLIAHKRSKALKAGKKDDPEAEGLMRHKLHVLKKVLDADVNRANGRRLGRGVAQKTEAVTLTLNPSISRANHFTFRPLESEEGGGEGADAPGSPSAANVRPKRSPKAAAPSNAAPLDTIAELSDMDRKAVRAALHQLHSKKQSSRGAPSGEGAYPAFESEQSFGGGEAEGAARRAAARRNTFEGEQGNATHKPSRPNSEGRPRVWMWPHVEGSLVGAEGGMVAYEVPTRIDQAGKGGLSADSKNGGGALLSAMAQAAKSGKNTSILDTLQSVDPTAAAFGAAAATAPFFFFLKMPPAQPFPPAPLPPPPPPSRRSDVYQRFMPNEGGDGNGGPSGPSFQPVCGCFTSKLGPNAAWAKAPDMPGLYDGYPVAPALAPALTEGPGAAPKEAPALTGGGIIGLFSPAASALGPAGAQAPRAPPGPPAPKVFVPLVPVACGDMVPVGGMPPQHRCLLVRKPVLKAVAIAIPKPAGIPVAKVLWDYKVSSIFVPRKKITDARSMTDAPHQDGADDKKAEFKWRAFEYDWSKCLLKGDRFTNLIKKGLNGSDDSPEAAAVKAVFKEHYDWLMYIFLVHASNDTSATSAECMGWLSYGALLDRAGVTDDESAACKQVHLDTIFKAANFTVKAKGAPASQKENSNPAEALERQEWLEVLLRVARAKFDKEKDAAVALKSLIELMREKLVDLAEANDHVAAATDLRAQWRMKDFYVEETDKVYRAHEAKLKALYDSRVDYLDVGTNNLWELADWKAIMDVAEFYFDESFTREEGNLCYYLSKFETVEYDKNKGDSFACLDWLSFLEALGHVVRYKTMPRLDDLKAAGFDSCTDLADHLEQFGVQGWNNWMAANPPTGEDDPFHVRLDECIKLLFHMLHRAAAKKLKAEKEAAEKAAEL